MLSKFVGSSVNHIRRDANKVAHILSKSVFSISYVLVDMEEAPNCIASLLYRLSSIKFHDFPFKKEWVNIVYAFFF